MLDRFIAGIKVKLLENQKNTEIKEVEKVKNVLAEQVAEKDKILI
jgi:hypothetical protein